MAPVRRVAWPQGSRDTALSSAGGPVAAMEPGTRSAKGKTAAQKAASKPGGSLYATNVAPTDAAAAPVQPVYTYAAPVATATAPESAVAEAFHLDRPAAAPAAASVGTIEPVLSSMTSAAGVAAAESAPPVHAPVAAPRAAVEAAAPLAATAEVLAAPAVVTATAAPATMAVAASAAPAQFVAAGAVLSQAMNGVLPAGFPPAPAGLPLLQWADNYWCAACSTGAVCFAAARRD